MLCLHCNYDLNFVFTILALNLVVAIPVTKPVSSRAQTLALMG